MNYKDINDYELLYLIEDSDGEYRDVVFEKYRPVVVSLANKYSDFLKQKGAEFDDVYQEALIGLNNAINSYKDSAGSIFYTFAAICIERQLKSYCRRLSALKHDYLNQALSFDYLGEDLSLSNCLIDTTSNVLDDVSFNEFQTRLIHFRHALPFKQSMVFELRFNGFGYKEISTLLDMSVNTVDGYLTKIRKKLLTEDFYIAG